MSMDDLVFYFAMTVLAVVMVLKIIIIIQKIIAYREKYCRKK